MLKQRLFTPGPTPVPEETLLELAKPVTYHRTAEQKADPRRSRRRPEVRLSDRQRRDRANQFRHRRYGSSRLQRAVAGQEGDPAHGRALGRAWRGIMKGFGINIVSVESPYGKAVQPARLAEALAKDPDAVAVFATLSETATGVGHDIETFGKIVAKTPSLLVVDGISGLGAMECRTDDWHIDICVAGSQKALMLPPGLAHVSVSAKAWQVIEANTAAKNFYFDLKRYRAKLPENDTPFTSANTLIKAQRISLKRIRAEGIENLWARHAHMAAAARAGIAAMGLANFAERPNSALTAIAVPAGIDGNEVLKNLEKKYGYKLANGQDTLKGKIWRLSHMGYCDMFDVIGALSALELALLDAGFKLQPGAGVAAAQRILAA